MARRSGRAPQTLVISSFPPTHCGIGAYAAQEAIALRQHGSVVHTVSLTADGAGTYRVNLVSITSILRLLIVLSLVRIDAARLHYVDSFLHVSPVKWRNALIQLMQCALWTFLAFRTGRRGLTVVVHEFADYSLTDWARWSRKRLFGAARRIEFHTAVERLQFEKALPRTTPKNAVVPHMRHFLRAFSGDQREARERLGLPAGKRIFLCLGFVQEHKGFDMAVRAFATAQPQDAELFIVGSVRHETPANFAYRDRLAALVRATPGVTFRESFVDDEAFDAWICASDMLLLPYREIWTSGVLARAMLYGRAVAMRDHSTLREQVGAYNAVMFQTEKELAGLIRRAPAAGAAAAETRVVRPANRPQVLVAAPLYGPMHSGGAEKVIADFAGMLAQTCEVEVWSSRSSRLEGRDNAVTDEPHEGYLRVRRFPTNVRSEPLFRISHRRVAQGRRGSIWQWLWARTSISGVGMRSALKREQHRFDVILLPHYFYGSTHRLADIAPAKTILHPFLHDEPALRTRVIGRLFGAPALVTHNSASERLAARGTLNLPVYRSEIIGNVVEAPPANIDMKPWPQSAPEGAPYLVYFGRLVEEKNIGLLCKWFVEARPKLPKDMRLVLVGDGPASPPEMSDPAIMRVGRVEETEKWRLLAHSEALVQLSVLESFSLVTLESWLAGRPVIVHGDCAATRLHVEACQGGHAVRDAAGFANAALVVTQDKDAARNMAARGADYVRRMFSEAAVKARLARAVDLVIQGKAAFGQATGSAAESNAAGRDPGQAYAARRRSLTRRAGNSMSGRRERF